VNYKIISITNFDDSISEYVLVDNGDDTFVSFSAEESNPNFVAFVEANPDWNK
jgi:hypothetical protein